MFRLLRFPIASLATVFISACAIAPAAAAAVPAAAALQGKLQQGHPEPPQSHPQETGFLNRRIELHGITYRFQVYLPEEWRRDDHKQWPILLFLHGRGERGTEGMWQTQIGIPQAVRNHPDRWPFIIVMPQCPIPGYWTDPDMEALAMATLDQESAEFHADPERTYLVGLSLGGYGAWELARNYPDRWSAIVIAASGIFWSYAPERWQEVSTLPAEYARAVGHTPLWLFHGADDPLVPPRESELMFDAIKAAGGHVRYWLYQGYKHDCWTRAFDEPELPRWLLSHRLPPHPPATSPDAHQENAASAATNPATPWTQPYAERLVIPFHPAAIKLATALLDTFVGDYRDTHGRPIVSIYRQGEQLFEKNQQGEVAELAAESSNVFFYLNGSATTRLTFPSTTRERAASSPFSFATIATKSAGKNTPHPPPPVNPRSVQPGCPMSPRTRGHGSPQAFPPSGTFFPQPPVPQYMFAQLEVPCIAVDVVSARRPRTTGLPELRPAYRGCCSTGSRFCFPGRRLCRKDPRPRRCLGNLRGVRPSLRNRRTDNLSPAPS